MDPNERWSRAEIRSKLRHALHKETLEKITHYVQAHPPVLWGEGRPDGFVAISVELALFKDITRIGYQRIAKFVKRWLKISHVSLRKNQQRIRVVLKAWATTQIAIGTLTERIAAARHLKLHGPVEGVTLWMDSTDVPLEGVKKVRRTLSHTYLQFPPSPTL
jgi:hypothetical protein